MTDPTKTVADLKESMRQAAWEKSAHDADGMSTTLCRAIVGSAVDSNVAMPTFVHMTVSLFAKLMLHCTTPGQAVRFFDGLVPVLREYLQEAEVTRVQDGPPRP